MFLWETQNTTFETMWSTETACVNLGNRSFKESGVQVVAEIWGWGSWSAISHGVDMDKIQLYVGLWGARGPHLTVTDNYIDNSNYSYHSWSINGRGIKNHSLMLYTWTIFFVIWLQITTDIRLFHIIVSHFISLLSVGIMLALLGRQRSIPRFLAY